MKFEKFINRQKAFKTIVTRLCIGEKTLVGFGNGSVNSNGCCKGGKLPVKQLFNIASKEKKLTCVWCNEAYTTKRCSVCFNDTGHVNENKIRKKNKKETHENNYVVYVAGIYGLRRCENNECRITWNRDHNAARNIFNVLEQEIRKHKRPEYLNMDGFPILELIQKSTTIIKKEIAGTDTDDNSISTAFHT